jgi:hypothetical protein
MNVPQMPRDAVGISSQMHNDKISFRLMMPLEIGEKTR